MSAAKVMEETALTVATPVELLRIAVSQNADLDKLTKLMDLQERWEKNEARKAFVAAMNAFKTNPPAIVKDKLVSFGSGERQTSYRHATLAQVCSAVTKGLSEHGISHRWKVDQEPDKIRVTCILTHDLGHSEETTLAGPADTSGAKNAIQAIGSAVTYLQRYTLLAATGLAAADDDATATGTNGEVAEQIEWLQNARNTEELAQLFKAAYAKFEANPAALRALVAAKNARKKELQ
jgi:hypothetical protein